MIRHLLREVAEQHIAARVGIDQTGAGDRAGGRTAVYIAPVGVVSVQRPFRQTNACAGCRGRNRTDNNDTRDDRGYHNN